jgi:hypothetical protein
MPSSTKAFVAFLATLAVSFLTLAKDPVSALFFGYVGATHLAEFFLGLSPDRHSNARITKTAFVLDSLQPVVLASLVYAFKTRTFSSPFAWILVGVYAGAMAAYAVSWWDDIDTTPQPGNACTEWPWYGFRANWVVYGLRVLSMAALLYEYYPWPRSAVVTGTILLVLAITRMKGFALGKVWCEHVALAQVLLAISLAAFRL